MKIMQIFLLVYSTVVSSIISKSFANGKQKRPNLWERTLLLNLNVRFLIVNINNFNKNSKYNRLTYKIILQ